eukprot:TRINITY_DN5651_c0_g1_i1.p1 TRINITY_DN5651_c0_g1~~TRINITY_DN5651_c0_g1_i1.p1  ORF type:complete len:1472 (-),score=326.29 TRINITY_DN5651_c0_g1_i1:21-3875(-)
MYEYRSDGYTVFEKLLAEYLKNLFERWSALAVNHSLTLAFFSRTYFVSPERAAAHLLPGETLNTSIDGTQWYRDTYRVVAESVTGDWDQLMLLLKTEFRTYTSMIGCNNDGSSKSPDFYNSSARQGNFLEAVNLFMNVVDLRLNMRDLTRTGLSVSVITAGSGVYEVSPDVAHLTKQRMLETGIGTDLLCIGLPPLHTVPLFVFRSANGPPVFNTPYWLNPSFFEQRKIGEWIPTCRLSELQSEYMPSTKLKNSVTARCIVCFAPFVVSQAQFQRQRSQESGPVTRCAACQAKQETAQQNPQHAAQPRTSVYSRAIIVPFANNAAPKPAPTDTKVAADYRPVTVADAKLHDANAFSFSLSEPAALPPTPSAPAAPAPASSNTTPPPAPSPSPLQPLTNPTPAFSLGFLPILPTVEDTGNIRRVVGSHNSLLDLERAASQRSDSTGAISPRPLMVSPESSMRSRSEKRLLPPGRRMSADQGSASPTVSFALDVEISKPAPRQAVEVLHDSPQPASSTGSGTPVSQPQAPSAAVLNALGTPQGPPLQRIKEPGSKESREQQREQREQQLKEQQAQAALGAVVNPFRLEKEVAQKLSGNRRRWAHIFLRSDSGINWTSLTEPATLPLTTDYAPTLKQLQTEYKVAQVYTVSVPYGEKSETSRLLNELISQRLSQRFQIVQESKEGAVQFGVSTLDTAILAPTGAAAYSSSVPAVLPNAASSGGYVASSATKGAIKFCLIRGNQFHILSLDGDNIEIKLYVPKEKPASSQPLSAYNYVISNSENLRASRAAVTNFASDESRKQNGGTDVNWNYIDNLICGNIGKDELQKTPAGRLRFVLLSQPISPSPSATNVAAVAADPQDAAIQGFLKWRDALRGGMLKTIEPRGELDIRIVTASGATASIPNTPLSGSMAQSSPLDAGPTRTVSESVPVTATAVTPETPRTFSTPLAPIVSVDNSGGPSSAIPIVRSVSTSSQQLLPPTSSGAGAAFPISPTSSNILSPSGSAGPRHWSRSKTTGQLPVSQSRSLVASGMRKHPAASPVEHVGMEPDELQVTALAPTSIKILKKTLRLDVDSKSQDRTQWMLLHYDNTFVPDVAYHFEIQWLACHACVVDEYAQMLQRRAKQYGLVLHQVPVVQTLSTISPLAPPLSFPLDDSLRSALEEELIAHAEFVRYSVGADTQYASSIWSLIHLRAVAAIAFTAGTALWIPADVPLAREREAQAAFSDFQAAYENVLRVAAAAQALAEARAQVAATTPTPNPDLLPEAVGVLELGPEHSELLLDQSFRTE